MANHKVWYAKVYDIIMISINIMCVSKIKSILSDIFHTIYEALCIQLTNFSYDEMWK